MENELHKTWEVIGKLILVIIFPCRLILFIFWSFLGPSAYEWIEKKLAPRQNKARTGELVAAGENGMGAIVLRIIDAQIDPTANNLNSSWVKMVSQVQ